VSPSKPRLILASASPRRREILATLGIDFEVRPSHADETSLINEDDLGFVREAALLKLRAALEETDREGAYVLAADTIVCIGGDRLGKPLDDQDALRMLRRLAGREHVVRTAVALGRQGQGELGIHVVETRVRFREASDDELRRYVASGESRDKAGAYAVQGLASGFVTRLEGSYTNVVGLPAAEVVSLLLEHGALEEWP
jgi:septum formation protein